MMRRDVAGAVCILVATAGVASAKLLVCPPGRFAIAPLGGTVLRLRDDGLIELEGRCGPVAARGRRLGVGVGGWRGRFAARFDACEAAVAVRARVEDGCDAVRGVVRTAGGRVTFRATRVAACGDGVVSAGEDCDDANAVRGDCCDACRAEPGCWIACERTADCAPQAVCERYDDTCRATSGICKPRHPGRCPDGGDFAVCGCDGNAYPTECAAWEAGVAVQGGDGLNSPVGARCRCRPDAGRACSAGRFCQMPFRCLGVVRDRIGGICVDPPATCFDDAGPIVCGCDGRTYRNDCERTAARVQIQCRCDDGSAGVGVACGLRRGPDQRCDCSGAFEAREWARRPRGSGRGEAMSAAGPTIGAAARTLVRRARHQAGPGTSSGRRRSIIVWVAKATSLPRSSQISQSAVA